MLFSLRHRSLVAFALTTAGCVDVGSQFQERQAEDQKQMAQGCSPRIRRIHETYCAKPMERTPVGLGDVVTQQRNSVARSCSDPESTSQLASLDSCIKEMRAHE